MRDPDHFSPLRRWAARRRIAYRLNSNFSSSCGFTSTYVETALPVAALAHYAANRDGLRISKVEHVGWLRRRWVLVPRPAFTGRCGGCGRRLRRWHRT
jgi:hypothetical protein